MIGERNERSNYLHGNTTASYTCNQFFKELITSRGIQREKSYFHLRIAPIEIKSTQSELIRYSKS